MKTILNNTTKALVIFVIALSLTSCASMGKVLNPFYEEPGPIAYMGDANDHALNGSVQKEETARAALDAAATYQRAHNPRPQNPVMQPAVVRLMWVPDHLNRHGDLVPAHYYYLKVLKDRWAVSDAFELEAQLGQSTGNASIPYVVDTNRQ